MQRAIATIVSIATLSVVSQWVTAPAFASTPDWAKPAVHYLSQNGYLRSSDFAAHHSMKRADFRSLMHKAFGGGYSREKGKVTAGEVDAALTRALGEMPVARHLDSLRSPDGWDPSLKKRFGTEVAAREMGLRHDWPVGDERFESNIDENMRQADIAWAVWQAKTSPDTYSANLLGELQLPSYGKLRQKVIKFAFSQVGKPYVYGGEWGERTPAYYPYGAQSHGGFDCSGFAWYVLREKLANYSPLHRHYSGWKLDDRSSSQMAANTKHKVRYGRLRPGDLVFFAPNGKSSSASSVYHAGIFIGNGWMVHSSGSRDGVSISFIGRGSWWQSQIAWGRHVIN